MTSKRAVVHFFNLDVLRAMAVIMVVVYHGYHAYNGWFHKVELPGGPFFVKYIENFFENMSLGVDFFFLISGFLITYLLLVEKENSGKISMGKFYVRRILRIWPLYFLIVGMAHFICIAADSPEPHYLGTLCFVNNFETISRHSMDYPFVHFWTLSIEEQYYLLWPLVLTFIPASKLPHTFIFLIVSACIYKVVIAATSDNSFYIMYYHSVTRGDAIVLGALIAWFHQRKPLELKISFPIRLVVYFLFAASFFLWMCISDRSWFELVLVRYFFLAGFVFVLLNYLFNPTAKFAFTKKNFLHYIGKISFGIYVYHNILLPFVVKRMYKWEMQSAIVFWLIYMVSVLLVSALSYEFLEKRILRFKDRFAVVASQR
jgi:peptidoglycan/LPS O-acetylase OafA/YrhL